MSRLLYTEDSEEEGGAVNYLFKATSHTKQILFFAYLLDLSLGL